MMEFMSDGINEAQVLESALALADVWRLYGAWLDAQILLRGLQPVAAKLDDGALARVRLLFGRVLSDEAMFSGKDNTGERRDALQQALTLAELANDPPLLGDVHDAIGLSMHTDYLATDRSQEPEGEMYHFERGLELRQQGGTAVQIAESLFHVGLVHDVIRREYPQAAVYHQQAYDLAREAGDKVMASYAIRHLGFTRWAADDKEGVAQALQESLQLRREAGFVPGIAMALVALAQLDETNGDKSAALPKLQQARAILASLEATARVAWLDEHLAEYYHEKPDVA